MKYLFIILGFGVLFSSCSQKAAADTIYTNGKIYTVDEAQAWA